jgi:hypothetical protein
MRLFKKCLCAYPCCRPEPPFLSPRGVSRGGPSALTRLGRTKRKERLGRTKRKAHLGRAGMGCRPEPFFVAPSEVRGPMGVPRYRSAGQKWGLGRTKMGARHDKNGRSAGQKWGLGRTKKGCSAGQRKDAFFYHS